MVELTRERQKSARQIPSRVLFIYNYWMNYNKVHRQVGNKISKFRFLI